MKSKIFIIATLCIIALYICYCGITLFTQDVPYVNKGDVLKAFNSNEDYFNEVANYFKDRNQATVYYDTYQQTFSGSYMQDESGKSVETDASAADVALLNKMCTELSFNMIEKDQYGLVILYQRLFDHNTKVGMAYDYNTEEWSPVYWHNYTLCSSGHHGYKLYDLIFN
ncbi:MAG: hypothetical protein IJC69_05255 [Clostridia bacterium]|nr:hypothetical protein [Clostridia bacterium]